MKYVEIDKISLTRFDDYYSDDYVLQQSAVANWLCLIVCRKYSFILVDIRGVAIKSGLGDENFFLHVPPNFGILGDL